MDFRNALLVIFSLLFSSYYASAFDCSDLNGDYKVNRMASHCKSDHEYMPGDMAPLYSYLPQYKGYFSDQVSTLKGYIDPNSTLKIYADDRCEKLLITYKIDNEYNNEKDNFLTMEFDVSEIKEDRVVIRSSDYEPYSCKNGVCGSYREDFNLELSMKNDNLVLSARSDLKMIIYVLPIIESKTHLLCEFK